LQFAPFVRNITTCGKMVAYPHANDSNNKGHH